MISVVSDDDYEFLLARIHGLEAEWDEVLSHVRETLPADVGRVVASLSCLRVSVELRLHSQYKMRGRQEAGLPTSPRAEPDPAGSS